MPEIHKRTDCIWPFNSSWNLKEYLKSLGADFHRVNRGGLITFHGPGQLVAYPILQLERRNAKLRVTLENDLIFKSMFDYNHTYYFLQFELNGDLN